MKGTPRRRRIDRITAPDYLDGLEARDTARLRAMREDCREEEARLSYHRRLLHARLDIARAEAARRAGGGSTGELVERLATILADAPSPRRPVTGARVAALYEPGQRGGRRADDVVADDASLGRLPDLDDRELAVLIDRIAAEERRISDLRRRALDHLDRLQDAIVERYRGGDVAVDEIVTSAMGGADAPADEPPR